MTDDIDAEAEALAHARYESGRLMLSGHLDDRPTDHARHRGRPSRCRAGPRLGRRRWPGRRATRPGPGSPCVTTMGTSPRTSSTPRPRSRRPWVGSSASSTDSRL